jgi:hypothetical protein
MEPCYPREHGRNPPSRLPANLVDPCAKLSVEAVINALHQSLRTKHRPAGHRNSERQGSLDREHLIWRLRYAANVCGDYGRVKIGPSRDEPVTLRYNHTTDAADSILTERFRDNSGSYGRSGTTLTGVSQATNRLTATNTSAVTKCSKWNYQTTLTELTTHRTQHRPAS